MEMFLFKVVNGVPFLETCKFTNSAHGLFPLPFDLQWEYTTTRGKHLPRNKCYKKGCEGRNRAKMVVRHKLPVMR